MAQKGDPIGEVILFGRGVYPILSAREVCQDENLSRDVRGGGFAVLLHYAGKYVKRCETQTSFEFATSTRVLRSKMAGNHMCMCVDITTNGNLQR